jgi:hypothetical protein
MHRGATRQTTNAGGVEYLDPDADARRRFGVYALTNRLRSARGGATHHENGSNHHEEKREHHCCTADQATSFHSETVSG